MITTDIKNGQPARDAIIKGLDTLANPVKSTLGPGGRNVAIEGRGVTKDGVSVAKEIFPKDPYEALGASLAREAAEKTLVKVGDNTTTSTVLAQAIVKAGNKNVVAGADPMKMRKGIDRAVEIVRGVIANESISVKRDSEFAKHVAVISANGNEEIGDLVFKGLNAVSEDGVVRVEDAQGVFSKIETKPGMEVSSGYLSNYFINTNKSECVLENPYILVCEKTISRMKDIIGFIEPIAKEGRSLLIIADSVEGDVFPTLVKNHVQGVLKSCAIKSPGVSDDKTEILADIAIKTGATFISEARGIHLDKTLISDLGTADKVIIGKNNTIIIGGAGEQGDVDKRVQQIKDLENQSNDDYEKMIYKSRVAKLNGGVATIFVGAASEVEAGEKRDFVDDALHASKAAIEEGIVPGGGVVYLKAIEALNKVKMDSDDANTGVNIVKDALEAPFRSIIKNIGGSVDVILNKVKGRQLRKGTAFGYDARKQEYCNLLDSGIVDSAKGIRSALENAASVANMFLTTESVIVKKGD